MKQIHSLPANHFSPLRVLLCLLASSLTAMGAATKAPGHPGVRTSQGVKVPQAVVLSVKGPAEFSPSGGEFSKLRVGKVLHEGADIRTGKDAHVDLFLQRLAITVRVTPNSALRLEKMQRIDDGDVLKMETTLDLQAGQIFCFVRGLVPNSKFEVKHAAGRSVVEGEGLGGYEIRAEGAAVTPRKSFIPLKIVSEDGVSVIAPGQRYDPKKKATMELAKTELEDTLMQLDELQALVDQLTREEDLPKKK